MITTIGPLSSGAAVGGDGVATANANSTTPISGEILAIYIKYNGSPPAATTDAVIATKGTSPRAPANTILTRSNSATDGWFYPRHTVHDEAAAAITYDATREVHEPVPVNDLINVRINGANAADYIEVWIVFRT